MRDVCRRTTLNFGIILDIPFSDEVKWNTGWQNLDIFGCGKNYTEILNHKNHNLATDSKEVLTDYTKQ